MASGYGGYNFYVKPQPAPAPAPAFPTYTQPPTPIYNPPPMPPQYQLPPAPKPITLPAPSPLPPPPPSPVLPPAPVNDFLEQLKALIPSFQNAQAFPTLSPEIAALLNTQKQGALAQFDVTQRDALDQQLASLFGRGVERSTIAMDEAGRLSTDLGAARAGIDSEAAARLLSAMQYQGQFGQQNLGALAGVLGSGASLEQGAYRDQINALLQQAGLNLQSYGQQSGNILQQNQLAQNGALGVGGLNQQQYGTQSGNILQQQQMSQQYQLAQQQMQQSLLQQLLGQIGQFSGSGSSGFNTGGYTSGGGVSPNRTFTSPYNTGGPTSGYSQQNMQQLLWEYLQRMLGGG